MKKTSLPKTLGRGFAYFQDTVDRIATFTFEQLRKFGDKESAVSKNRAEEMLHKTSAFLGEMGTEYYRKYSEIKKERESSEPKKQRPLRKNSATRTKKKTA